MGDDITYVVRYALLSALRGDAAIRDAAHVIDDGMLNRPPYPHLQWIEAKSSVWGAKDRPGGEVTAVLVLRDKGQRLVGFEVATGRTSALPMGAESVDATTLSIDPVTDDLVWVAEQGYLRWRFGAAAPEAIP